MPIYNLACIVSAYLNEDCQHSQAIWCISGYIGATVFRIVVHDVNLWGQEKVSQGQFKETSDASGFQERKETMMLHLSLRPSHTNSSHLHFPPSKL